MANKGGGKWEQSALGTCHQGGVVCRDHRSNNKTDQRLAGFSLPPFIGNSEQRQYPTALHSGTLCCPHAPGTEIYSFVWQFKSLNFLYHVSKYTSVSYGMWCERAGSRISLNEAGILLTTSVLSHPGCKRRKLRSHLLTKGGWKTWKSTLIYQKGKIT